MLAQNFLTPSRASEEGGVSANDSVYPLLPSPLDSRTLAWCCPSEPTLGEAWLAYLQECWRRVKHGDLAYETVRRYADLRSRLEELGARPIHELRSSEANSWHARLSETVGARTRRPTRRTADLCRDLLKQVCDFAELQDWRPPKSNPVSVVPRNGMKPRELRFELEECRRILAAVDVVERRRLRRKYRSPLRQGARTSATQLIRVMFLWGRRPRELRLLRWEQLVGLDGPKPIARRIAVKRGIRSIAVPEPVANILLQQHEQVGGLSQLVFPSGVGTPLTTLWHTWHEVLTIAEVPEVPLYGLRHNVASHLIEEGFTTKEAAVVLGNTEGVVRRHYDHALVSPLEVEVQRKAGEVMARIGGLG
ncbi:hypothetical protein [Nannocystis exedens]|uniref:hypothetical protein n=1 Tax=Nannocystis exedens TaxID=54 RepID=UPI000BBA0322|nr:hypothetical protein [Nannocystis exedens]PCC66451.1 Phage integrase family protein [Nannocystis exedens]